jgi:hypothetical protein
MLSEKDRVHPQAHSVAKMTQDGISTLRLI